MNNFRGLLVAVMALAAITGFTLGGVSFQTSAAISEPVAAEDNNHLTPGGASVHVPTAVSEPTANSSDDDSSATSEPRDNEVGVSWSHGRDGSSANAEEHWRKHGAQFSEDHNAREYEDEASNFVHSPPARAEIKHRENGDTLIYDHDTNTFAVEDSHGNPRTMFKPERGEAYWDRQH